MKFENFSEIINENTRFRKYKPYERPNNLIQFEDIANFYKTNKPLTSPLDQYLTNVNLLELVSVVSNFNFNMDCTTKFL